MKPFAPAWRDTALPNGPYTDGPTVYHHRRLVDRRHNNLRPGTEATFLNWPLQDYPTNVYPQHVVDALEAIAPGTSQKNLVEMTPRERRIVFEDAKNHALGLVYHLQTTVADRDLAAARSAGKEIVTFRDLKLTDEFGTPDRLPPKPYIREGMRPEALYMLREQDVRDTDGNQCWAATMVPDGENTITCGPGPLRREPQTARMLPSLSRHMPSMPRCSPRWSAPNAWSTTGVPACPCSSSG